MKRAMIALVVALCLLGIGAFVWTRHAVVPPPTQATAAASYWTNRIRTIGGARAYQEFEQSVSGMSASDQHGLAHIFGGALYHSVGLAGITVCDTHFSYGCYHELIGDAIATEGLSAIDQASALCSGIGAGCKHGMGHGILSYFGYEQTDLKKAVAECDRVGVGGSRQGCLGGVFMEYNMRTLASSHARDETADLYAPCDAYRGVAAESCYLYQPQWWWVEHFAPSTSTVSSSFKRMGMLCNELSSDLRASCYKGVGFMVPPNASYMSDQSIALCALYSGIDRVQCSEGAAVVLKGTEHDNEAMAVCRSLPEKTMAACMPYAQGATVL
jgi:hypothetical protein